MNDLGYSFDGSGALAVVLDLLGKRFRLFSRWIWDSGDCISIRSYN